MDTRQNPGNLALRIGGVAPNVIRELSGIYPTFVSAFKELVSNAYDADASQVTIRFSPDLSAITVEDNGIGMTPFEFQSEYIRIGGSSQQRSNDLTVGGRRPVGRKGIGFLAVARYCQQVNVYSQTDRTVRLCQDIVADASPSTLETSPADAIRLSFFGGPFASELKSFVAVQGIRCGDIKLTPTDYEQNGNAIAFSPQVWYRLKQAFPSAKPVLTIEYAVDCRATGLEAVIDYDYLLNLQDSHNLETIHDFCQIRIVPRADVDEPAFTRVTLYLREFVRQELQAPQRRGRVRNVGSASGLDRFLWELSRSAPVSYALSDQELTRCGLQLLTAPVSPTPFAVHVAAPADKAKETKRPLLGDSRIWRTSSTEPDNPILVKRSICIDTNGLAAQGYILGFRQPIFPAELRGIAVRVRGVEIGTPGFLGVDHDIPVKYRLLLNQVMGEVIVTEGLDAIGAIMPGRESFYVENAQVQTLKDHLIGDGTVGFGVLGIVLEQLYRRYSIESSVARIIQETRRRRQAFLDVSHAVTSMSVGSYHGRALRRLFARSDIAANGLHHAPEHPSRPPGSIGEYEVEMVDSIGEECELKMEEGVVRLNRRSDIWKSSLYVLGRDLDVSLRDGGPDDPVCEIDFSESTIYLNWMHPTRARMGDAMFIKSALFWRIAYLAADGDVDVMMNLAHRLLSA